MPRCLQAFPYCRSRRDTAAEGIEPSGADVGSVGANWWRFHLRGIGGVHLAVMLPTPPPDNHLNPGFGRSVLALRLEQVQGTRLAELRRGAAPGRRVPPLGSWARPFPSNAKIHRRVAHCFITLFSQTSIVGPVRSRLRVVRLEISLRLH